MFTARRSAFATVTQTEGPYMTAVSTSTGLRRLTYMTDPGEPLEVASSVLRSAVRHRVWVADTGIDPMWVKPNPLCCVPLPTYPEQWPAGLRRWPRVRAAMMWHPLLWLPDRLATRYTLVDDNGTCSTEPDDIWCLRVCLELQAAGLYDTDTGSWLDVLSLAGLDSHDPDTSGRVDRWLTGGSDPVLDCLDLTEHVDRPDDLDWGLHAAIDELPAMRILSWVLTAQDLLEACDALRTRDGESLARIRRSACTIAMLAQTNLATFSGDRGADDPEGDPASQAESVWWQGIRRRLQQFTGDRDTLIDTVVRDMADRLGGILDAYEPDAAELIGQ